MGYLLILRHTSYFRMFVKEPSRQTLATRHLLNWFKRVFTDSAAKSTVGANGLLYTPYIVGERAPHPDADIRGSFTGVDGTHKKVDFVRAVLEGIIFSFKDIMDIYDENDKEFDTVVAIGGGAKSPLWLQIQADIFNKKVVSLTNEQGPGMGAAMIAAVGLGWFKDFQECAEKFVHFGKTYVPNPDNAKKYDQLHKIYAQVYDQTKGISKQLLAYRRENN